MIMQVREDILAMGGASHCQVDQTSREDTHILERRLNALWRPAAQQPEILEAVHHDSQAQNGHTSNDVEGLGSETL